MGSLSSQEDGKAMLLPYMLAFCRIVIGLVFAISFIGKAWTFTAFGQAITRFDMLPQWAKKPAAFLILTTEFGVVALMVIGGSLLNIGFALAAALLFVFSIAITSALTRKIEIPCNCFGTSDKPVSIYEVGRNGIFIMCAVVGYAVNTIDHRNPIEVFPLFFTGAFAFVFVAFWIHVGEVAQLLWKS